jgi:hypothetical protein
VDHPTGLVDAGFADGDDSAFGLLPPACEPGEVPLGDGEVGDPPLEFAGLGGPLSQDLLEVGPERLGSGQVPLVTPTDLPLELAELLSKCLVGGSARGCLQGPCSLAPLEGGAVDVGDDSAEDHREDLVFGDPPLAAALPRPLQG